MFKKGIDVIVLPFNDSLCLLMLQFFRVPLFPSLLLLLVRGNNDLLVYTISSPTPTPTSVPIPVPVPVKPLITQVYSQR